jgi:hypothetical protein
MVAHISRNKIRSYPDYPIDGNVLDAVMEGIPDKRQEHQAFIASRLKANAGLMSAILAKTSHGHALSSEEQLMAANGGARAALIALLKQHGIQEMGPDLDGKHAGIITPDGLAEILKNHAADPTDKLNADMHEAARMAGALNHDGSIDVTKISAMMAKQATLADARNLALKNKGSHMGAPIMTTDGLVERAHERIDAAEARQDPGLKGQIANAKAEEQYRAALAHGDIHKFDRGLPSSATVALSSGREATVSIMKNTFGEPYQMTMQYKDGGEALFRLNPETGKLGFRAPAGASNEQTQQISRDAIAVLRDQALQAKDAILASNRPNPDASYNKLATQIGQSFWGADGHLEASAETLKRITGIKVTAATAGNSIHSLGDSFRFDVPAGPAKIPYTNTLTNALMASGVPAEHIQAGALRNNGLYASQEDLKKPSVLLDLIADKSGTLVALSNITQGPAMIAAAPLNIR